MRYKKKKSIISSFCCQHLDSHMAAGHLAPVHGGRLDREHPYLLLLALPLPHTQACLSVCYSVSISFYVLFHTPGWITRIFEDNKKEHIVKLNHLFFLVFAANTWIPTYPEAIWGPFMGAAWTVSTLAFFYLLFPCLIPRRAYLSLTLSLTLFSLSLTLFYLSLSFSLSHSVSLSRNLALSLSCSLCHYPFLSLFGSVCLSLSHTLALSVSKTYFTFFLV